MASKEKEFSSIAMFKLFLIIAPSLEFLSSKVNNDTHMKKLVLYWKKSLKYKVGCFWRFHMVYTSN